MKEICRNIAADEIRHYKLFYRNLTRCLEREQIGFWQRLRVASGELEAEDDELAYAYYAANESRDPMTARYQPRLCAARVGAVPASTMSGA